MLVRARCPTGWEVGPGLVEPGSGYGERVERGSQSNRREDDQRAHEIDGMIKGQPINERRSDHLQETVGGDGEPEPNPGRRPLSGTSIGGEPSPDVVAARRELAGHVEASWFPIDAGELLLRLDEAPPAMREAAEARGAGRPYETMVELLDDTIAREDQASAET